MNRILCSTGVRCLTALFLLLFFCSSCLSRIAFGNGNNWIPKDFDPQHSVFLIKDFGDYKKAKDFMSHNYPYAYEFVSSEDAPEYSDLEKYRFVLVPTPQLVGGPINGHYASTVDFYFYDRLTERRYAPLRKGSYKAIITFRPLIKTIVRHSKR